jgi:hypothetical protein
MRKLFFIGTIFFTSFAYADSNKVDKICKDIPIKSEKFCEIVKVLEYLTASLLLVKRTFLKKNLK